jgi:hypothetical protein
MSAKAKLNFGASSFSQLGAASYDIFPEWGVAKLGLIVQANLTRGLYYKTFYGRNLRI